MDNYQHILYKKISEDVYEKTLDNGLKVVIIKKKDYKKNYYVVNDENYLISLYRGKDENGKVLANNLTVNLLEATKRKISGNELYPSKLEKLDLYKVLKIGKIVILQNSYEENVCNLAHEQIWNRMYRISGLSKSANLSYVKLSHVLTSKPWAYIPGNFSLDDSVEFRRYQVNNFIGLVEGLDFSISPTGEIIKI